jgi:aerobic carbon-monoxide dehydrogenase medium subunit
MQILSDFELHRPTTVEDAAGLRAELGEGAALYAGGTELLLAMKMGVLDYAHLIDLKRIASLGGIELRDGELRIGAGVTHRELETDPLVAERLPALAALERNVANVRVRSAGTLAGNLAFAEPHADPPALLTALDARVELVAAGGGRRELPVEELIVGAYETSLAGDEVIAAVLVPLPGEDVAATYLKFQVLERPAVGVAAVARVAGGVFAGAPTVVVGAVDERPVRVDAARLDGAAWEDTGAFAEVADAAREAVEPVDDLSGSAEYKRHLTGVLVQRALRSLLEGGAP